jgi:arylsulfatase A-like enzyme
MQNSRLHFMVVAAWFGLLTGLLEGLAFRRFPHLENPDLPWIAVLFALGVFLLVGVIVAVIAKPTRVTFTLANLGFALVMFYDVVTVGVLDHRERILLRIVALALSGGFAFIAWRYAHRMQVMQQRSLFWIAVFVISYTAVPAVMRARNERKVLSHVSAPQNDPNVLLVIVDTLRADHLSSYGYSRNTSPFLTQFAGRGVQFQNAISAASWTLPSHASIMTGRLPHEHGADRPDSYLDNRFPTIAEAFARRGYHTAAFSANWWLFARRLGFGRGFMHFEDFNSVSSAVAQTNLGQRIRNVLLKISPAIAPLGRPDGASITRDMLHWIDYHPGPFFIAANYMDVHEPYTPPLECLHQFSKLKRPRAQVFLGNPRMNKLSPEEVADEMDAYDASIRCMDSEFASLVHGLEQRGLMRNTIVVLTSDHGDEFNEHGLMSHSTTLYRELIHVPLIMVGPGIAPAGIPVDRPVSLLELPATLIALSRGGSQSFTGPSLDLAWKGSDGIAWPEPVSELAQLPTDPKAPNYYGSLQSVINPDWHLIVGGKNGKELYHWRADAAELTNVAAGGKHAELAEALAEDLKREESGQLAIESTDKPAGTTPPPQKSRPVTAADRDKNNDYLKALGYIPN